jgi:hypothetical protein
MKIYYNFVFERKALLSLMLCVFMFGCSRDDEVASRKKEREAFLKSAESNNFEIATLQDPEVGKSIVDMITKTERLGSKEFLDDFVSCEPPVQVGGINRIELLARDKSQAHILRDREGRISVLNVLNYIDASRTKENTTDGYEIHYNGIGKPRKIMRRDAEEILIFYQSGIPRRYILKIKRDKWVDIRWDENGTLVCDRRVRGSQLNEQ